MPVSLNNSKDIIANSVSVIKGNKTIDVIETIDAVQGLAPETLNSLEKLATALNNDSNYFQTVSAAISTKADTATVNTLLDAKVDDTEMVNYATKATTYTKTEVDDKCNNIIAGAPNALNTLKE
jgi:predicted ATP-grasp superfamily ATP-dependent carboligase